MKKRILFVDDDEALLFAFRKVTASLRVEVDTAASLDEAKRRISEVTYAAVVTDMRFNEQEPYGGIEVIRHARDRSPGVPTVLWTAFCEGEYEKRIAEARPDYLLTKPAPLGDLVSVLRRAGVITEGA